MRNSNETFERSGFDINSGSYCGFFSFFVSTYIYVTVEDIGELGKPIGQSEIMAGISSDS